MEYVRFFCFSAAPADVEGNEETATVVDLVPWTEYEFRVIATNTLGTGEPSSPSPKEKTLEASKKMSGFYPQENQNVTDSPLLFNLKH